MPEGDTIHRAARTLDRVLGGQTLSAVESPIPQIASAGLEGASVSRVEARGKNLLVLFDDGRVLHTHMRMSGSWHVYRPGERWQRPRRHARVVLATPEFVTVCFDAPVVRLLRPGATERDAKLAALGPDMLAPGFDRSEARRRLRALGEMEIGEALLRQSAVAGIGNVYKSETLFLCRQDPFAPVGGLSDRSLELVLDTARRLMSASLHGGARATRRSLTRLTRERTWVYGRRGRPCRRCGTSIRMRRQGVEGRSTYWCPSCQAGPERPG
jgi:endonuclease-8